MFRFLALVALLSFGALGRAAEPAALLPLETEVADLAAAKDQVTLVHFWAPWCHNCKTELAKNGWRDFVEANRDVRVIFVTVWSPEDGKRDLTNSGLGTQPNFSFYHHPNHERSKDKKMTSFLGHPVEWIPTTWVMKGGKIRYALNYGEVRFPLLQQLVRDAGASW